MVSRNIAPEDGAEKIFVVANGMCRAIAKRMGKGSVDADVIRRYFLLDHSKVVDERFELMKDFDPVSCNTRIGIVKSFDGPSAVVETDLGRLSYKTLFAKDARIGDRVVVHYDFIIEKASADVIKWLRK